MQNTRIILQPLSSPVRKIVQTGANYYLSVPSRPKPLDLNKVVSENFKKILDGRSPEDYQKKAECYYQHVTGKKAGKKVSPRKLRQVAEGDGSTSLDVIVAICHAEQLQPYQLMFPDFDAKNAPVVISKEQADVLANIKKSFDKLPVSH